MNSTLSVKDLEVASSRWDYVYLGALILILYCLLLLNLPMAVPSLFGN